MADELCEALMRVKAVSAKTTLSRSAIHVLEKRGKFPKRVAIGSRAVAWKASEIQAWIESRAGKEA